MRFTRTKCLCSKCPLSGKNKVHAECGIDKPAIAFIAEAPGAIEDELRKPLVGASGRLLQRAASKAGIIWHTTYRTNVLLCRPVGDNISTAEAQEAIKCCMPGFLEEVEYLQNKLKVKAFGVLGATAMKALGIEGRLSSMRGSVTKVGKTLAIPTFHPSYIMLGNWSEVVTWSNDLMKLRDISLKKWSPPTENFNLFPTMKDVENFSKQALATKKLVAVDIETTSLSPYYSKILMVGLAMDGENAIVIPFTRKGGAPYWNSKDEKIVREYLAAVLNKCPTMFQNAMFDTWHLQQHGLPVGNLVHDTMLLHHAIHPELPHNLGYIVSIYGKTPYWKEVVLNGMDRMINMEDSEVRTYNARDTVVLHQILPGLLADLKETGTERTYREWSMKLVGPLRRMSSNGLLVDKDLLNKKGSLFKRRATTAGKEIFKLCDLPDGFNFASPFHMRRLLYGIFPPTYKGLLEEIASYDNPKPNGKMKSKATKAYAELIEKRDLLNSIKPLYLTNARIHRTDSGLLAADDEAIQQIQRAAINKLDAIDGLTRKTEAHKEEEKDIEKLLKFITIYRKYAEAEKLASTFTKFPVMPDGRVHPSFKIHGTATGRLSSSDPNGQNIPGEVQDVFVSRSGWEIIKGDYSNIEYRVMAIMTGEKWLEEEFNKGVNFHDINTKLLFGIEKDHPQWSVYRRAAKVFIFGLSYGGSVEGIYIKLLAEVPEMRLTLAQFKKIVNDYFARLPNYAKWCDAIKKQARETRVIETAFGRKRILLGLPDEIERQALNTPIQGTAGEICELALINLDAYFQEHPELQAELILTVHDSILVTCPTKNRDKVAKIMKKLMEAPVKICGRMVSFPVDFGHGTSWAQTEEQKLTIKKAP